MDIPQFIILSTQRSGTHLLESFAKTHPEINGRGEVFLRVERNGIIGNNEPDKINIGILMYNQVYKYTELGGDFTEQKIIHLVRDPGNVALSRLQMAADKQKRGKDYKAHYHCNDEEITDGKLDPTLRGVPDLQKLGEMTRAIAAEQQKYSEMLADIVHLELHYEKLLAQNSDTYLHPGVETALKDFLGVKDDVHRFFTTLVKTGLNL